MHSAFNLLVFPNSMFTPFFDQRAMCSLAKWHIKITIIIIDELSSVFEFLSVDEVNQYCDFCALY